MESSCVRQTSIPATSQLFGDFLYDFSKVSRFYSHNFQDDSAWNAAAAEIAYPDERRLALAAALEKNNENSVSLQKFRKSGTVAVVTGQQVGLFSGPAYTLYKALTAVRLAQYLTQLGIPAVPVFWLATEDHDLAEVAYTWVFNSELTPAKVSFFPPSTGGGPVGDVALKEPPLAELRKALSGLPFADDVVEMVAKAYRLGSPLGHSFRQLLKQILGSIDLVFIDPLDPAVRAVASPFLNRAVEAVPELLPALLDRNKELAQAGYHAQVNVDRDSSLLFQLDNRRRTPLRWKDGRFHSRDSSFSVADLQGTPETISPNALLRPVMQDYLLPTIAYVGGPAEIAYMAQAQVLYKHLLGRMPVIYPRNSMTLLDGRASKILDRYDLRTTDLLEHHDLVRSRMARTLVPGNLLSSFHSLRASVQKDLGETLGSLNQFDPTLRQAGEKSAAKILYQIEKLTQKTARESMRRDERASRDAAYLLNLVYPERHLQERFFSILPFLAKVGLDLPQQLVNEVQLACPDHTVRIV